MRTFIPSLLLLAASAAAQRIPINDLGTGMYLGQLEGGLYENGSNQMPADHRLAEMRHAASVEPLDRQLRETDRIADASRTMLDIAQENDAIAREFNATVQNLVSSGKEFESEVARFRLNVK